MNANKIKEFRKRYKLTQSDLAEIVKSSVRAVQSWEQEQRNITQSAIKLMLHYEQEQFNTEEPIVEDGSEQYSGKIPYYNIDFAGGWSSDEVFGSVNPDFYLSNPEFYRCDFACNLRGKSVSKIIPDGAIVGFKIIEDWQTYFPQNELYGIITKNDFRTVKLVSKTKDGKGLLLRPIPAKEFVEQYTDTEEVLPMDYVAKFLQVVAYGEFKRLVN